ATKSNPIKHLIRIGCSASLQRTFKKSFTSVSHSTRYKTRYGLIRVTTIRALLSLHDALPTSGPAWPGPGRGSAATPGHRHGWPGDRKSTRLNSSHVKISYAVFCLKKKTNQIKQLIRNVRSANLQRTFTKSFTSFSHSTQNKSR